MAIITQTFGEKIQAKTSIYIFDISDFYLADQNPSTMLLEKRWWSISKIDSLVPIFLYYSRLVGRQIHEIGGGSLTDSLTLFQSFSTDKLSAEDGVEQKKHLYISPLLPTKTWEKKERRRWRRNHLSNLQKQKAILWRVKTSPYCPLFCFSPRHALTHTQTHRLLKRNAATNIGNPPHTSHKSEIIGHHIFIERPSYQLGGQLKWVVGSRQSNKIILWPRAVFIRWNIHGEGGEKNWRVWISVQQPPPPPPLGCSWNLPLFWPAERGAICTWQPYGD